MKNRLSFFIIIFFTISTIAFGQNISFFPKVSIIYLIDGCTGVYMKYSLAKSNNIDSIKISPGFNTNLFYNDSSGAKILLDTAMFLVNKKDKNYNYELYLYSNNYSILIPPDSLFNVNVPDYYIKLIVKEDSTVIDSLLQQFHSDWGVGVEEKEQKAYPENYSFINNYPNPFNPSTTVKYMLPSSGEINLSVYDMLGKLIITLKNGYERTGMHQILWYTHNLRSGVYFIVLRNKGSVSVTKSVLVK